MIKRIALFVVIALSFNSILQAQNTLSSKDMIGVTPMISSYLNLPGDAVRSLEMKLTQIATQNGFGSFSGQFVLTPNVVVINKSATATAPVQHIVELEVSFFVVNVMENVIVDEMSYTVQGIDRLENKAFIRAINEIKPKTAQVRTFMNNVREQIIIYYNTRIPALISKAKSLSDRTEYDEALAVLASIPESVDQYPMVAEQMVAIYQKKIDREASAILIEAKGYMTLGDYENAMLCLASVDPNSSKFKEAHAMLNQIKGALTAQQAEAKEKEIEEMEQAMKRYDDAVMLEKMRIESAQKVGVASAKSQASLSESLNKWFFGKFK